jgi:hypothetical protein
MRAPPNEERAAPGGGRGGSQRRCGVGIWATTKTKDKVAKRLPQLRCAYCGKQFAKTSKRPAQCCSRRCRDGLLRETARFDGAPLPSIATGCCTLKKQNNSKGCKAPKGNPHPSRISVPINVLGRDHKWPGAQRLDRKILDAVRWREIG